MKSLLPLVIFLGILLGFSQKTSAQVYVSAGVNQPALLVASAGTDPSPICPGDSVTIGGNPAASGGTPTYDYSWASSGSISSSTVANPIATPAATASYVLTVTDDRNCTSMDTVVVEVTTCVGIEDPNAGYAVSVFPNPAQAEFKIRVEGIQSAQNAAIEITDLTGRSIFSQQLGIISGDFEHTLNATQFSK